ncbi:hypothetical protein ABNQ39_26700 [Azospirillum sp. A26]|uniref:hypothetical protein n=1 Tax=Azospirillum sp. A26 TaxID=3160607 RepID=UPI003671CB90
MENTSHAFLDAVHKSMRQIRAVIGVATVDPALLRATERIQYEGYLCQEKTNSVILALAKGGVAIKETSATPATAASSSGRSCAVSGPTSSGSGKARLTCSSPGWMYSGLPGDTTRRTSGIIPPVGCRRARRAGCTSG